MKTAECTKQKHCKMAENHQKKCPNKQKRTRIQWEREEEKQEEEDDDERKVGV